ncbi:hypothetical protein HaLaN_29406 [Haematococcus lacustris]|uniref:Uncharacterized protein n=1 Tax=Haematococcus lacustris TaxID=44745 RepID=A0A6A0AD67_HAELA|nr:hypothetical protein HaLaN_29406 [Haematococcus lacustris]
MHQQLNPDPKGERLVPPKASNDRIVEMAGPLVDVRCYQGPRGRSAARLQEDEAQAAGAPPAAG